LSRQSFCLLLLCFFITFYFSIDIDMIHQRLALWTMTLNDEHRVILTFSPSCPSSAMTNNYLLHQCYCFSWMIKWDGNEYSLSSSRTGRTCG
jgi:hypothetical protein